MNAYLGLDVGTTAVKAVVVDETGRVRGSAAATYGYQQPRPGWVEQDPAEWIRLVADTARRAAGDAPGDIKALAVSTQGDTALPVDAAGRPLAAARTWMDTRTQAQVGRMLEVPQTRWYEITGATPLPHAAAASILWWQEHLEGARQRIHGVCLVQDFLTQWLTGQRLLDAPNASRTLLYDIHRREWSEELLSALDIPRAYLADVAEAGTPIGPLLPTAAAELGLSRGTTVVLGGHDQTCAAVGCGVTRPGSLMLSCGTAWVVLAATSGPLDDPRRALHSYCHAVPRGYAALGAFAGGNLLRWFRDELVGDADGGEAAYESIVREAETALAGGRAPLLFLPHFYGSVLPVGCPSARGGWVGLTLAHTRGDMALALLQGVALQAAAVVKYMVQLGAPADDVRMIGGGSRSRFWAQLVADALHRSVKLPAVSEAAAYGAALIAGRAMGAFGNDNGDAPNVSLRETVTPGSSVWPAAARIFEELSTNTANWWQEATQ
ncbi:MAG: hypothetical protein HPY69_11405 [Armatimonadetes bacterium]|nr:hypothetical protein [Armatimonadota bacterium]